MSVYQLTPSKVLALTALSAILAACGAEDGGRGDGSGASGLTGINGLDTEGSTDSDGDTDGDTEGASDGPGGNGGPRFDLGTNPDTSAPDEDDECAAVSEAAELVPMPADIIVVVDNSGSMSFEAGEIQANMNNFSNQIIASGIDVRVVLVSSYPGNGHGICIEPPLGGGGCNADDNNPPTYTHVNQSVGSSNAWARLLQTHDQWAGAMREESSKHLLIVTDDTSNMSFDQFDQQFRALDPSYADYIHHSVVCHSNCPSAAGIGNNYISLSNMTGGVAADLCDQNFQAVFDVLSTEVISGTQLACEFEIPAPPGDMEFDPDEVNLEFDDGAGGLLEIGRVDSAAGCADVPDGWYYDNPAAPTSILVCSQTCDKLQLSESGAVNIKFGCASVPAG